MSFLSDLADSLTGKSSIKYSEDQLKAQLGFQQSVLDQQTAEAKLKYSPELNAQRMKLYLTLAIILAIVAIVYIKHR